MHQRGPYHLTDDATRMDAGVIHRYLSEESYWARGIPRDVVERSLAHSLCVGVFHGHAQVAFARVVTDRATYAYLCDVFVLEEHRGQGLGKWMVEALHAHPELQGLRRWGLVTRDAHALYAGFGWTPLAQPEGYMERRDPDVYRRGVAARAAGVGPLPDGAIPTGQAEPGA